MSPVGWYIASYLERLVVIGEDNENPKKRFLIWENTIIIKAKNPDEAYKKAIKEAGPGYISTITVDGKKAKWVFEGLTSLLPIYEKLEDGAEIMWKDHRMRTLGKIRRWAKLKKELEVFSTT